VASRISARILVKTHDLIRWPSTRCLCGDRPRLSLFSRTWLMERKLKPSAKETFFTPKSDSTPELFAGSPHSQSNERKGEELLQRGKAVAQTRLRERGRRRRAAGPTPEAVGEKISEFRTPSLRFEPQTQGAQYVEYDTCRSDPLWGWQAESRATLANSGLAVDDREGPAIPLSYPGGNLS
jgi:hypothetical protein